MLPWGVEYNTLKLCNFSFAPMMLLITSEESSAFCKRRSLDFFVQIIKNWSKQEALSYSEGCITCSVVLSVVFTTIKLYWNSEMLIFLNFFIFNLSLWHCLNIMYASKFEIGCIKEKTLLFIINNFLFWVEDMEINLLDKISTNQWRAEGNTLILLIVPKVSYVQMLSEDYHQFKHIQISQLLFTLNV